MISLFDTPPKKKVQRIGVTSSLDPTGKTGILRDTAALDAMGFFPAVAISAIDVYGKADSFSRHEIPGPVFSAELNTIFSGPLGALKIGTLGQEEHVERIAEKLDTEIPVVFDPSFISKRGEERNSNRLLDLAFNRILKSTSLFIVNHQEAQYLARFSVFEPKSMRNAAKTIYERFGVDVLVTGGHFDRVSRDIYYDGSGSAEFGADFVRGNIFGTGATYSALITCELVSSSSIGDAIAESKERLSQAISNADDVNGTHIVQLR